MKPKTQWVHGTPTFLPPTKPKPRARTPKTPKRKPAPPPIRSWKGLRTAIFTLYENTASNARTEKELIAIKKQVDVLIKACQ